MSPGGIPNPSLITGLKNAANGLPSPSFFPDYFSSTNQDSIETQALRDLPGGYNGSDFINPSTPTLLDKMTQSSDAPDMQSLMDKIKNGVSGCCPPK